MIKTKIIQVRIVLYNSIKRGNEIDKYKIPYHYICD